MGKNFLSSHGYNTGSFLQKQGFNFYFMECENRMWRIGNRYYPKRRLNFFFIDVPKEISIKNKFFSLL